MVILMEYIALLDFVGDLFLLVALLGNKHTAWTILSVFTMICPYIISYIPLINFQIQRYSFITQDQSKRRLIANMFGLFTISPLVFLSLILMDFTYVFNSTVIVPGFKLIQLYKRNNI